MDSKINNVYEKNNNTEFLNSEEECLGFQSKYDSKFLKKDEDDYEDLNKKSNSSTASHSPSHCEVNQFSFPILNQNPFTFSNTYNQNRKFSSPLMLYYNNVDRYKEFPNSNNFIKKDIYLNSSINNNNNNYSKILNNKNRTKSFEINNQINFNSNINNYVNNNNNNFFINDIFYMNNNNNLFNINNNYNSSKFFEKKINYNVNNNKLKYNNNNKDINETKKKNKPFTERKGDWICNNCKNLNFAFRLFCNRCHLDKEKSEKINKFNNIIFNNNNIIINNINNNNNNINNNNNNDSLNQSKNIIDYKKQLFYNI